MDSCFKLDWLSFTWFGKKKDCLEDIQSSEIWCYDLLSTLDNFLYFFPELKDYLDNNEFIVSDKAGGFYSNVYICNSNVRISFNTDDALSSGHLNYDVGVNVSIPSHALEWFYNLLGFELNDISGLVRCLTERNCTLSRIDLAFDDFQKKYTPHDYYVWFEEGRIRSKFFQFCSMCSSTRDRGKTIYFGRRSGGRMLRIYDKDYQSKGQINSIRYEFELHADYAKGAQRFFLDHDKVSFFDYLISYFQVIDLTGDSNKSRCPVNQEWLDYFAQSAFCEQLVLPSVYTRKEREEMASKWLLNTCIRDIKGFVTVFGFESLCEHLKKVSKDDIPIKYRCLLN